MGLNEDMERIALQERELVLPRLDAQVAWELGVRLRSLAEVHGHAVVIDVRRFGQPLFYTALEGTTPDNVEWVRRKINVVARFHSSSYAVGLKLKTRNETLTETQGLPRPTMPPMAGAFRSPLPALEWWAARPSPDCRSGQIMSWWSRRCAACWSGITRS